MTEGQTTNELGLNAAVLYALRSHLAAGSSDRQLLNVRPLGPEGSTPGSDTVGSDPTLSDVPGIIGLRREPRSDTFGSQRSVVTAPGTIQAQRTIGTSPLLKVAEVAERLRLSRATVYRLVADGRLAAVRVSSGALRISAPNDGDCFE